MDIAKFSVSHTGRMSLHNEIVKNHVRDESHGFLDSKPRFQHQNIYVKILNYLHVISGLKRHFSIRDYQRATRKFGHEKYVEIFDVFLQ